MTMHDDPNDPRTAWRQPVDLEDTATVKVVDPNAPLELDFPESKPKRIEDYDREAGLTIDGTGLDALDAALADIESQLGPLHNPVDEPAAAGEPQPWDDLDARIHADFLTEIRTAITHGKRASKWAERDGTVNLDHVRQLRDLIGKLEGLYTLITR